MSFEIIAIVPMVYIGLVLKNVIARGEQIRKIKERTDQMVGMICGVGSFQIQDAIDS